MDDTRENYPDDEIELIDILRVVWKWKWLIIGGTLLCAVIAGAITYNQPKVYSVDMVLRPGVAEIKEDGGYIYIDSEENIKAIIGAGTFNHRILSELNGELDKGKDAKNPEKVEKLDFGVELTNNTNTLKVSYETAFVERGLFVLERLHHHLKNYYEPIVERFKKKYELNIQEAQTAITKTENRVSRLKSDIKATRSSMQTEMDTIKSEIEKLKAGMASQKNLMENQQKRVAEIEEEIDRVAKNTDHLVDQRNAFLKQLKNEDNILSSIIYSNTIQQNISYLDTLKAQKTEALNKVSEARASAEGYQQDIEKAQARFEDVKEQKQSEMDRLKSQIQDAKSDRAYTNEKIRELEFEKKSVGNLQQLQEPIRSPAPVGPRMVLNVALAFVAAFFVMLFVSFFAEY
ncbi:MAG: Wzz/FepE/Etk N-terminal domain-containing protein, partial [Thermodesulfobacteriota bacterium]